MDGFVLQFIWFRREHETSTRSVKSAGRRGYSVLCIYDSNKKWLSLVNNNGLAMNIDKVLCCVVGNVSQDLYLLSLNRWRKLTFMLLVMSC